MSPKDQSPPEGECGATGALVVCDGAFWALEVTLTQLSNIHHATEGKSASCCPLRVLSPQLCHSGHESGAVHVTAILQMGKESPEQLGHVPCSPRTSS